jgi:pantoate--beta-alanine ligase
MQVIETAAEMRAARAAIRGPVGFVPTMGYLHDGHISLVERARAAGDMPIVSIFVNPTQFLPGEDYERYPRDVPQDLELCERAGVAAVYTPQTSEIYP